MADSGLYNPTAIGSVAVATNPTSGTVMADSGVSAYGGTYRCTVILSASAAAAFNVARRNAANSADVAPSPLLFYCAAGQSGQYVFGLSLAVGERVVVRMAASLTGQAQAVIVTEGLE